LSYCPLCAPQVGISDDGEWVIVRFFPKSEIDQATLQTRLYELETGMHIIREGWFKGFEKIDENILLYEQIHSYDDWTVKHMLDSDEIEQEMEIATRYL